MPACERTLRTFENAGFHSLSPLFAQQFKPDARLDAEKVLRLHGWQRGDHLVLLNPAGLWETRNWPLNHYAELVCTWPDSAARFLFLGTGRIKEASRFLSSKAGNRMIDLSGQTSLALAYALLQFVDCAITEDSGLMHMAWSQGIPLVALFGSSPHYWSLPAGDFVHAFHSGDLSCGACMQPRCKYGDNRCLTRVTPDLVIRAAESLMRKQRMEPKGQ
jgi:ADP-heptose:LPS heptosyltransferase